MKILGHDNTRERLSQLFQTGKLPHTMLFVGSSGIGKRLVAQELAQSLFCDVAKFGGCDCKSCNLFNSGNTPDYYYIECLDKENWNIEKIKTLLSSLHLKPFAGKNRVVLFNNAEHLSIQASNALLKFLEEPQANTYVILVAANAAKLPETIVSRCQVWFFDDLNETVIKEILTKLDTFIDLDNDELSVDELIMLADGSVGNINSIKKSGKEWHTLQLDIDKILSGNEMTAYALSQRLSKNRESLRENLQLVRIYIRKRMKDSIKTEEQSLLAKALQNLISVEAYIFERNINAGIALHKIFLNMSNKNSPDLLFGDDEMLHKIIV